MIALVQETSLGLTAGVRNIHTYKHNTHTNTHTHTNKHANGKKKKKRSYFFQRVNITLCWAATVEQANPLIFFSKGVGLLNGFKTPESKAKPGKF